MNVASNAKMSDRNENWYGKFTDKELIIQSTFFQIVQQPLAM